MAALLQTPLSELVILLIFICKKAVRKSYSLHKFRHLVKPFLVVCPDGHIIDIYGLYEATKSDATILSEIMRSQIDPFHWFFNKDDVLSLDRGFRDSIEEVESCGYRRYMPASKDETEYQLSFTGE
ncbi:hypothetical protein K1T71_005535 [Dendrolimus kikuchii]|uniref:Uncharacterized protein n=1 Tax=Dendrolimus kikuchii TaxID=765133 RepID=A0ACC1D4P5_9NEOP|nr:hypothetical protein K1T71_005535 [Dendrolimus kikuchii]